MGSTSESGEFANLDGVVALRLEAFEFVGGEGDVAAPFRFRSRAPVRFDRLSCHPQDSKFFAGYGSYPSRAAN
jgi:hypothetical protein